MAARTPPGFIRGRADPNGFSIFRRKYSEERIYDE
jgi:hypothetical protein